MVTLILLGVMFLIALVVSFMELKKGVGKIGTFIFRNPTTESWVHSGCGFVVMLLAVTSFMDNPLIDPLFDDSLNKIVRVLLYFAIEAFALIVALNFVWGLVYLLIDLWHMILKVKNSLKRQGF